MIQPKVTTVFHDWRCSQMFCIIWSSRRSSRGLMDKVYNPRLWVWLQQELSTIEVRPLSKAPTPQMLPAGGSAAALAAHCSSCVHTWMG